MATFQVSDESANKYCLFFCSYTHTHTHTHTQYFFSSLEEASGQVDDALIKKGLKFRDNLTKKYNWDFSSEAHEFAPTVVELT